MQPLTTMMRPRRHNAIVYALYANALLLLALLVVMADRGNTPALLPAAFGQNQPPIAGGAGIFVMPAQFSSNTWGCYLLDVDTQTLCAYQFYPGDKLLRLIAARNFRYDRKLGNFNTTPSPQDVSDLVQKEMKAGRTSDHGTAPVSPETP